MPPTPRCVWQLADAVVLVCAGFLHYTLNPIIYLDGGQYWLGVAWTVNPLNDFSLKYKVPLGSDRPDCFSLIQGIDVPVILGSDDTFVGFSLSTCKVTAIP